MTTIIQIKQRRRAKYARRKVHDVLIDDCDAERVMQYKWHVAFNGYTYYVKTYQQGEPISLHWFILGLTTSGEDSVDHIDGNGLNNTRANLRICTRSQNQMNRKSRIGSSRFKGVSWHKRSNSWEAYIYTSTDGRRKKHGLGHYKLEEDAALAYDRAARTHSPEYRRFNFPEKNERPATA